MSDQSSDRDPLEMLAAEFTERLRQGQHPSITEYVGRCPDLSEEIRELFPTIAAMEQFKERREAAPPGPGLAAAEAPRRLGDYRIVGEIGRGGMGIVYEAEQVSLRRPVAVKILPRMSMIDPRHLQRFQREAQMPAKLHHTNIVPVFGVGHDEGYHYIVMQRIEGVGLDEILAALRDGEREASATPATMRDVARWLMAEKARGRPRGHTSDGCGVTEPLLSGSDPSKTLPPEEPPSASPAGAIRRGASCWRDVAEIGAQAAEALNYAHSQGVLHRDIKPANLLVDGQGVVWISDFGLAKAQEENEHVSRTGDLVGTLRYMAPEQLRGQADHRSDLFSLGLTLYEAVTLTAAFDDTDRSRLIQRIVECHPSPPRKTNAAVPRDLETIILKAIAREPKDRYASGADLAADLRCFLEDRPIRARRVTPLEQAWRWARRNPVMAGLSSAVLILLVMVALLATAGYFGARHANQLVHQALDESLREGERAQATSKVALDVLDQIYAKLSPGQTTAGSTLSMTDTDGKEIQVPIQPELSPQNAVLLESLLTFYDRLAEQGGESVAVREGTASALCRVAAIQSALGQVDKAVAAYEKAKSIYEQLADQSQGAADYSVQKAHVLNELGSLYRSSAQPDKALSVHRTAVELLKPKESGASQSAKERFERARTYYCLATMGDEGVGGMPGPGHGPPPHVRRRPQGEGPPGGFGFGPPDRRGPFSGRGFGRPPDRKGPMDDRGFGPPPDREPPPGEPGFGPPDRDDRGFGPPPDRDGMPPDRDGPPLEEDGPPPEPPPGALADGSQRLDFQTRAKYLEMARQILDELCREDPSEPSYQHLLALCYRDAPLYRSSPEETLKSLGKATEILARLADKYPAVPEYRHDLVEAYAMFDLRGPMLTPEKTPMVQERLKTALELAESLAHDYPSVPAYTVSLVHVRFKMAEILQRAGRGDEADEQFREAAERQQSLVDQFPKQASYRIWLAILQHARGRLLVDRNRPAEAQRQFEQSIATLEPLHQGDESSPHLRGFLGQNYHSLADVLQQQGKTDEAAKARDRGRDLRPRFAPPPPQ